MYTRSQVFKSSLEFAWGFAVVGTIVGVVVGGTGVSVAASGTDVSFAVGGISVAKTNSVAAAGALHPINNIPIIRAKYLVFIVQPP
jgi:hypothetical protein